MANEPLRMQILNMIENGDISTEEGLRWLEALANDSSKLPAPAEPVEDASDEVQEAWHEFSPAADTSSPAGPGTTSSSTAADHLPIDAARIRRWWVVPLWIGVGITVVAGLLMYWAMQAQGIGFWFACASVPFALGLLLMILAAQSRNARWLYLRVEQPGDEWPRTIQFGFPLPIRPTAWLLRLLKGRIPNMPDVAVDEMLLSLGRNATPENPFYINVNDEEDGEKVEIYIG
jgi:hypothetical protein